MFHSDLKHMIDALIEHPEGMIVDSKSKHAALYTTPDGDAVLLEGDLSGPRKEMDDKIQRFADQMKKTPKRY